MVANFDNLKSLDEEKFWVAEDSLFLEISHWGSLGPLLKNPKMLRQTRNSVTSLEICVQVGFTNSMNNNFTFPDNCEF